MSITMIVPTQGRETLERLLESVTSQGLEAGDECIIAIDAYEMPDADQRAIADRVQVYAEGSPADWITLAVDAGAHSYGHDQINAALDVATPGNYITANDDDDIYAPGAFDAIRQAIADDELAGGPRLHLFRFQAWFGMVLPVNDTIREGHIGGHSLVIPNVPGRVGRMTPRYAGDWDWIADTVKRWDEVVFEEAIIAIARPGRVSQ